MARCAVCIGVGKTGGLRPLESAVSGAKQMGALLKANDYDVTILTDEKEAVTAEQVEAAITTYVDQQQVKGYELLVVFFTGHGYWKNEAELWLLSHAPARAGEAVNFTECILFAQDCRIPNVILISDACQTVPQGKVENRVKGSPVFPNIDSLPGQYSKVDRLRAARAGQSAYEVKIGKTVSSVFTASLLKAYDKPDPNMVLRVQEGGNDFDVVPNRRLEGFLLREVEALLASLGDPNLIQEPSIEVTCGENVYMARVNVAAVDLSKSFELDTVAEAAAEGDVYSVINLMVAVAGVFGGEGRIKSPVHSRSILEQEFQSTLQVTRGAPDLPPVPKIPALRPAGLINLAIDRVAGLVEKFETNCGITVSGFPIDQVEVVAGPGGGAKTDLCDSGGRGRPGIVRVWLDGCDSATALVVLSNGTAIPVAALRGYIAHVIIRNFKVQAVSYIPTSDSARFGEYLDGRAKLIRMRGLAIASLQRGQFVVGDPEQAQRLAILVREGKAVDPLLGLYASYAYFEAGMPEQAADVREILRNDLLVDLFDSALLTVKSGVDLSDVVPFCPILTQGWNYLRSRRVSLPPVLAEAQNELLRGPWTMFPASRARQIVDAIRTNQL